MQAYDLRKTARENLRGNWPISIAAALVVSLLGGMALGESSGLRILARYLPQSQILPGVAVTLGFVGLAVALVKCVLGGAMRLGYDRFLIKQHDHTEKPEIQDLFSQFDRLIDGFCLSLLVSVYIFLWTLLLIVPGIVANYRYAMADYIMLENPGMTAPEAIRASKQMMQGHKGELFMLDLSFIGWSILAALSFGIGGIFLAPYTNAAHAAFYRNLCAQQQNNS